MRDCFTDRPFVEQHRWRLAHDTPNDSFGQIFLSSEPVAARLLTGMCTTTRQALLEVATAADTMAATMLAITAAIAEAGTNLPFP